MEIGTRPGEGLRSTKSRLTMFCRTMGGFKTEVGIDTKKRNKEGKNKSTQENRTKENYKISSNMWGGKGTNSALPSKLGEMGGGGKGQASSMAREKAV